MDHKKYLAQLGAKGGRAKSKRKTLAARINGRLGGLARAKKKAS